jgi:pyrimidine-nucleoside phosphorylase
VRELTLRLGEEMLVLGGAAANRAVGRQRLERAIASGEALEKFRSIVAAQGGDPRVCDAPAAVLPQPKLRRRWESPADGIVQRIEPRAVGRGITAMGGGRTSADEGIDPSVGFSITVRPGDRVTRGQALAEIQASDEACLAAGRAALDAAIVIGEQPVVARLLVSHRIDAHGVEVLH